MKGLDDLKGLNGLKAVMQAADDAGAASRTYVPGYPITDLAAGLNAEISINEKVALEIALGASATGLRSMVVVKQVGMNALADPLVISATHNIGSGLVLIAGDDLGPRGSQVEMDSRFYGPLAKLPCSIREIPRICTPRSWRPIPFQKGSECRSSSASPPLSWQKSVPRSPPGPLSGRGSDLEGWTWILPCGA